VLQVPGCGFAFSPPSTPLPLSCQLRYIQLICAPVSVTPETTSGFSIPFSGF